MRIISIGDLVVDFYYKNKKLIGINGGITTHNIIANISKFGLKTSTFGVCGDDIMGKIAIDSLRSLGVDVDNVVTRDDISTRCFHVSYTDENEKITFISKKRCPFCNTKKWYDESMIESDEILKKIEFDDVLVFDNLNVKNQTIIDKCKNKKMIDIGQYFELENYSNEEIIHKIKNKFDIINLNERVEKYLIDRFSLKTINDVYMMLSPKLLIVTRGKKGSNFVYNNNYINKKLDCPSNEVDPTGAGDAFFSVFISEYVKNKYVIDDDFITNTFNKATKITKIVVKKFSARGHLQKLYRIKKLENECTCNDFEIVSRKQIKRCNINVNNLEVRILNAIHSSAYKKIKMLNFESMNNVIFIGTGGSYAGAKFSAKVINHLYGINSFAVYPRELYYRNNDKINSVFLFSYSGTTNDLLVSSRLIDNKNKYIITKGELQNIVTKTDICKNNIISYRTGTNKGKERGFLSFEGALAPASLFLNLYFEHNDDINIDSFIKNCINYWKEYFANYFKDNKQFLSNFLKPGNLFNIFLGDFTEAPGYDLESKIIESGIFNCILHEKKNFSHGRFINYEHLNNKNSIYFKQNNVSLYEEKLLDYLKKDNCIVIESKYNGLLCEFDLLVASQYLIYYISNFLDIDMSKPTYSEDAMKIYFYKGNL